MLAKKLAFFLWGAAFSSLWWARCSLDLDPSLWIPVVILTVFTVGGMIYNFALHWDDTK